VHLRLLLSTIANFVIVQVWWRN